VCRRVSWQTVQQRRERLAARCQRLSRILFAVAVILCVLSEKETFAAKVFVLAPPFLLLQALSSIKKWAERSGRRAQRAAGWYEERSKLLAGEPLTDGPAGMRFRDATHLYALDLDLFGLGSLFERTCLARTSAGENALADWLRSPADPEEVRARQSAIAELCANVDLRENLFLLGVERTADVAAIETWAREPQTLPTWGRFAALALVIGATAALVGWVALGTGALPLAVILLGEVILGQILRQRTRSVLAEIAPRLAEIDLLAAVFGCIERGRFQSPRLTALQERLREGRPSRRFAQLARRIRLYTATRDPFLSLGLASLLWTTHIAYFLESWRFHWGSQVRSGSADLGDFEALVSLAGRAFENPHDPFPELVSDGPLFDAEGLGHPLLRPEQCVTNDVRLDATRALLIVSGSNMSGKSTLLRSVGLNTVLALAGAPVRARRLRLSVLVVGATMCVQDSLSEGISRFYAELQRVRQIVSRAHEPRPVLFLLDELFAGTNSADRRIGAEAVLRALLAAGAIGLTTTHDVALTELANQLMPPATNVHFVDDFDGTTIVFDHRMRPGVVPRGNALALLRAAGIEV
jgi:MutS domain V